MQVQYVYHCCLCLIFDQITMAQEQKYLRFSCNYLFFGGQRGVGDTHITGRHIGGGTHITATRPPFSILRKQSILDRLPARMPDLEHPS